MEGRNLFICRCDCTKHQMFMTYYDEPYENMVYVTIHLNKLPLHKRIWHAIKYIFGYTSEYGDFEEFIFNPKDADKLQEVVNYLKNKQQC